MRLAIAAPANPGISETFINSHLKSLDPVAFYHSGIIPQWNNNEELQSEWMKGVRWGIEKLVNKPNYHLSSAFKKSLKKEKVDVVLAEYGYVGANIFPICERLKIPLVVHFHGFEASSKEMIEEYGRVYRRMFESAFRIISVSKEMTKDLINLGCSQHKIEENPYGPNPSFFDIDPCYNGSNLISVGRFVDKKAPYYLILAFKEISDDFPEAKLMMVGDGFLKNSCDDLVKFYGLQDKISLVGAKDFEFVYESFKNASIFLQHSVCSANGDKEGSPVAVIEAGAAGLPVISTKHAGIVETVVDGKSGFLVEEHDVIGFAEKLKFLLQNENLRKKMGSAGKTHISENFSMEKHINSIKRILKKAADE